MADLLYTFLDLKNAVTHAVGKTLDTGASAANLVNDALAELYTMKRWKWRQASETLALTISQSYIALASDYGRTIAIDGYPQTFYRVRMVTEPELNMLRQRSGLSGFDLFCSVSWTAQASLTVAPIARLEIFPTSAASVSNVLTHLYERRIPKLADDTDVPDCPPQYHAALKNLCRACALDENNGAGAGAGERAIFDRRMQSLIEEDVLSQPTSGAVPGATQMLTDGLPSDARFYPITGATVA